VADKPARDTPEWWLQFYQQGLEKQKRKDRPGIRSLHDYTEAIGRTYLYLGKPELGLPYLQEAIELCLTVLQEPREVNNANPVERGYNVLRCAQEMWRIEDPRAEGHFRQAFDWLVKGMASEDRFVRKEAWWLAGITHLFLGDFRRAREALDEAIALWARSDVSAGEDGLSLLTALHLAAEALEAADVELMKHALVHLKTAQKESGGSDYGMSPHPGNIVLELLTRRIGGAADLQQDLSAGT
jgi:tetratricopeptide (TPR) repeat protein